MAAHEHRASIRVIDLPELRDRVRVFRDRVHAGHVLAQMLSTYRHSQAIVLAVPAGGVPVAAVVARELGLPLDVVVVSKITPPWNTEVGYGAVAFDGTVVFNQELLSHLRLTKSEIAAGVEEAAEKVGRRLRLLRGELPPPELAHRSVILIDDGLASGFTLQAAAQAVSKAGTSSVIVAVPTGHQPSIQVLRPWVEIVYCANLRGGWQFAVADAYQHWYDESEEAVADMLRRWRQMEAE